MMGGVVTPESQDHGAATVGARTFTIAVLPGDGIGPEVIAEGLKVLDALQSRGIATFQRQEAIFGGAAIDAAGTPLPEETLSRCLHSDAVLLGAVGGPRW